MKKTRLKKRLRKKLHVGEFQQFGFQISAKFDPVLNELDSDRLYDEFIEQIEENGLSFGGGPENIQGFIASPERFGSRTVAQREKIKNWLTGRREISDCEVGNFKDAWYD